MHYCWSIARKTVSVDIDGIEEISAFLSLWPSYSIPQIEGEGPDLALTVRTPSALSGEGLRSSDWLRQAGGATRYAIDMSGYCLPGIFYRGEKRYGGRFLQEGNDGGWLQGAIKNCFSFMCEGDNELLLHASGVLRNGKAWLFCGPSGAGKTTIATRLNGSGEALCVDMVVLSVDKDNVVRAASTPFGEDGENLRERSGVPVAGICLIEQADRNAVEAMEGSRAVSEFLVQSLGLMFRTPERIAANLDIAGSILEKTRCYGLRFEKNDTFWSLLDAMVEGSE